VIRTAARVLLVAALAAGWIVAVLLLWRSSEVPPSLHLESLDPRSFFADAVIRRADRFGRLEDLLAILSMLTLLAVFAAYARFGARLTSQSLAGPIGTGMLLAMLGFALAWLAQLPYGLVGLWWERRYGVSSQGYLTWALQNWIGLGGTFLFVCLGVLIVMGLARPLGDRWWIAGAPAFVGLAALFTFVQPWLIPGLHRLHDPALSAQVHELERKDHLPRIPIEVQDVHTETSAPNAEATGIGPSRRVVLWDTLLDGRFSNRQVRVVLAHELGHLARNHLVKGIAWFALFALPIAWIIARVTRRRGGMRRAESVPLALFVLICLELVLVPVQNAVSRHIEAEADWVALQTARDPQAQIELFRRFGVTALEEPRPPTWTYVLLENHPTLLQRIAMARAWRRLRDGG
jgi:STE24 endopeptidase